MDQKPTWFPDGRLNTAYNCLDRHVKAGHGHRVAFQYVSVMPQTRSGGDATRRITYAELLDQVEAVAGVLRHTFGVAKGDRAVVYMPMIPEAAVTMLACARIGAIHSVVFGGFASKGRSRALTSLSARSASGERISV